MMVAGVDAFLEDASSRAPHRIVFGELVQPVDPSRRRLGYTLLMFLTGLVLALSTLAQQPADRPAPDMAVLKAGLGDCSADFTVKDAGGAPLYGATIRVSVRHGFMNLKRADLEIGTNADGRARIEGLPAKAKTLNYDIRKDGKGAIVQQDVATVCRGVYEVSLKNDVKDPKEQPR